MKQPQNHPWRQHADKRRSAVGDDVEAQLRAIGKSQQSWAGDRGRKRANPRTAQRRRA